MKAKFGVGGVAGSRVIMAEMLLEGIVREEDGSGTKWADVDLSVYTDLRVGSIEAVGVSGQ